MKWVMKGVTVPGSNSSTAKRVEVGWGAWKDLRGPEQPGLFKGSHPFFHLSPHGDRGRGVNDGGGID